MERRINMLKRFNKGLGIGALVLFCTASLVFVGSAMGAGDGDVPTVAMTGHTAAADATPTNATAWAYLAAALATGLGSIAAGYAVANEGAAAMAAVAEKPELMGKSLIYVALAEGIAIYGLLISIIILSKV